VGIFRIGLPGLIVVPGDLLKPGYLQGSRKAGSIKHLHKQVYRLKNVEEVGIAKLDCIDCHW
jgi:hypothetical protein